MSALFSFVQQFQSLSGGSLVNGIEKKPRNQKQHFLFSGKQK